MKNSPLKMRRASTSATLLILSILLLSSVSWATSQYSVEGNFVQCLSDTSHSYFPISESIYTQTSPSFSSVLQSYIRNLRFTTSTTPKPLVIVTAMEIEHVRATVVCAKSQGLQIRIRSGGHDYEGLSYVSNVPFVVLDLYNMGHIGGIDLATETTTVMAGATLGELYYRIAEQSKVYAFPAGICFTLGTGGHFTGGGYGNLMRKYGLSVDNIIDALIVDVNGTVHDRKSMGEDLFWAIRGGGGASFGVIVQWTINLVRVPSIVTVFRVEKTLEQGATEVVYQWQQVADKLDNDLFIRVMIGVVNGTTEGTKTVKASFVALFLGQTDRLVKLMNESFPELGLQPKDCIETSWVESTLFWANYPNGTSIDVLLDRIPKSEPFLKRKSDYVKEPISKTGLELIWKKMIELGKVGLAFNPYGGKMSEISESATPFPHRAGNIYKIQYTANWNEKGIEATNRYINETRELFEFMTPYVSKDPREAFLNYRDLDIGTNSNGSSDYGAKYFKSNFERLVRVKTMVDPENFFRNEQSIPTLHTLMRK